VFKIITWNVNSVNSRLSHLILLLKQEKPNIVLLQETKCENYKFPIMEIEELGYNIAIFGQKSYNGVAILSLSPIEDVQFGLNGFEDSEARYIKALTYLGKTAVYVASVYVPNGNSNGEDAKNGVKSIHSERFKYKLEFLEAIKKEAMLEIKRSENFIFGGDINVSPEEIDVYSVKNWEGKVSFLPEERAKIRAIRNTGMTDAMRLLAGNLQIFSWYDYRTRGFDTGKGLRIDHIYTSPSMTDALKEFKVLEYYRGLEKPSDHVPMEISLSINIAK
jgi:exodeoxyribonuclease-3